MVFGISSDKYSDSHTDEMKELKNQVKLVELDLEKRMILLENSINSIQRTMGTLENFESSRDAIIELQETKKALREIEDVGLISKLETINNSDKISTISDTVDEVNEKIKLLSDAMEILAESKSIGGNNSSNIKDMSSINSEIALLKNALSKMSSSMADPQKISELNTRIASLETANNTVNTELKKIYDLYHEKISFLERRISYVSPPSGPMGAIPEDIFKMKEEIEQIKKHNKKLAEMIEINSKSSSDKKNLKTENSGNTELRSIINDLSIKVDTFSKEMNIGRATYPNDIANIKKEMNDVKAVQKSLADVMESIIKTKKEPIETANYKEKIKNIEKSINDISGKISDALSLNEKIVAINNEITSLKANKNKKTETTADYRQIELQKNLNAAENKKMDTFEISLNELTEKINGMQKWKDGIGIIENRINLIEKETSNISKNESRIKESADNEEMLSSMVKSIAEENKSLRQEIEQLKQVCAQIMNDNQQQPIIID